MTKFKIGDEEYSEENCPDGTKWNRFYNECQPLEEWNDDMEERQDYRSVDELEANEINTTYDQNQVIGDSPSYYPAGGAEPIDAKNGTGFLDIDLGEEKFKSRDQQQWYHATGQDYLDDEPHENRTVESLNKDGTGIQHATRGVNPNNPKYELLKFIYVSKSDCKTCKQYDGKVYHKDDPDRPIIPRLESGYSAGKDYSGSNFTHPHCKCKWVYVFNKAQEFELIDPVPFASMAKLAYDAIKPTIMDKLGMEHDVWDEDKNTVTDPSILEQETAEEIKQSTIDGTKKAYGDGWNDLNEIEQEKEMVYYLEKAVEGGRGSGKRGHQKWMLGAEGGFDCEICMCITDRNPDGTCMFCGN